ncbi:MAG: zinc-binding alcohol dehydrogenase [Chloroflexi bacterium]|nr:zinc-binding alcohol dehydrogenase [Chloroflexota bacterium]
MKYTSILFTGPDQIAVDQVDYDFLPLSDHDVLVQTHYSLISAGTELACLSGVEAWFRFPGIPGYASIGEVVDVGAQVTAVSPGDIVYGMGGHRQYQLFDTANPRTLCVKAPEGMDLSQAVFTRMICVAFTALRISNIELGDYVAVTGLGLVGNFAAQLAGLQGGRAIGLDLDEKRVGLAQDCGIANALVIDQSTLRADVKAITGGADVTTLIEATGNPRALPPVLPIVGRYGEVILLGTPRGAYETNLTAVLSHVHLDGLGNVTFKGAHEWRYPVPRDPFVKHSILRNAELALDLIRSGDLQVLPLHTHTLKPEQAEEAYDGLKNKKDEYIGVVFDWTGVAPTI